jgi:hypothetical protein
MEGKIGEEGNREGKETFLTIHKNTKKQHAIIQHLLLLAHQTERKTEGHTFAVLSLDW